VHDSSDAASHLKWRKSSYSGPTNDCIEVRDQHDILEVRDSTDPRGAVLGFSYDAWNAFTSGVRAGEFQSRC